MVAATTYPVAVAFSAKPGDHVLIVQGVCIGVRPQGLPARPQGEPDRSRGRPHKAPPSDLPRTPGGRLQPGPANERLFAVLREHGPLTAGQILDRIGISPKDNARRIEVQRLDRLRRAGKIQPIKEDKNSTRPRLQLVKS